MCAFKCGLCGIAQPPRTKPRKIVTVVRTRPIQPLVIERQDKESLEVLVTVISREDRQIVQEKDACPRCAINPPAILVLEEKNE
jgi:hypothetical protein